MAEAAYGPAPVDYVWVAAGSQALNEQTAKSDQDNSLILDDAYDEVAHGAYFKAFAKFVCGGLAAQAGEVSAQSARDLRDALEFLGKLRIAHQARQTRQHQAPDNFLALDELSNLERSHLKDAFSVVQTLQGVLGQRYQSGRF